MRPSRRSSVPPPISPCAPHAASRSSTSSFVGPRRRRPSSFQRDLSEKRSDMRSTSALGSSSSSPIHAFPYTTTDRRPVSESSPLPDTTISSSDTHEQAGTSPDSTRLSAPASPTASNPPSTSPTSSHVSATRRPTNNSTRSCPIDGRHWLHPTERLLVSRQPRGRSDGYIVVP